jgi:hypothetical protein
MKNAKFLQIQSLLKIVYVHLRYKKHITLMINFNFFILFIVDMIDYMFDVYECILQTYTHLEHTSQTIYNSNKDDIIDDITKYIYPIQNITISYDEVMQYSMPYQEQYIISQNIINNDYCQEPEIINNIDLLDTWEIIYHKNL